MTFWDWCHEHYLIAGAIVFCVLFLLDAIQQNYFASRGRK